MYLILETKNKVCEQEFKRVLDLLYKQALMKSWDNDDKPLAEIINEKIKTLHTAIKKDVITYVMIEAEDYTEEAYKYWNERIDFKFNIYKDKKQEKSTDCINIVLNLDNGVILVDE